MSAGAINDARLSFGLEGQSTWGECGVIHEYVSEIWLTCEGTKTYSVDLLDNVISNTPKLPRFTCLTPSTTEGKDGNSEFTKTQYDVLPMTLKQMRTLKVTADFCTPIRLCLCVTPLVFLQKRSVSVSLEIPQDLIAGKLYQLVISSNHRLLSARLVEQTNSQSENNDTV